MRDTHTHHRHHHKPNRPSTWRGILGNFFIGILLVSSVTGFLSFRNRTWRGQDRFTVVTLEDGVKIQSFDPQNQQGKILLLPQDLEIQTVGGRGRWRIGALPELAKKFGERWAADSVTDYLGIGYTAIDNHLAGWDTFSWWWNGRSVEWQTVKLEDTGLLKEFVAPDGTKLQDLAPTWNSKAAEWFTSSAIAQEGMNLTLVNSTDVAGLGSHAARSITNAGIRVSAVSGQSEEINGCVVESTKADKEKLSTVWVKRTFGCSWNENGDLQNELILKLGTHYREWWLGKD